MAQYIFHYTCKIPALSKPFFANIFGNGIPIGDRANKLFERVKVIKERSVDEAFTAFEAFAKDAGLEDVKVLDVSEPN